MEAPMEALIGELGHLVEETTIRSICHDFDLTKPEQYEEARSIITRISGTSAADTATGFDPSGLGGLSAENVFALPVGEGHDADLRHSDGLATTSESSQSLSLAYCVSSRSSVIGSPEPGSCLAALDDPSLEPDVTALIEAFPMMRIHDVKLALKKTKKGDTNAAIDELLNKQYFQETGERVKGVDGFFKEDEDLPAKRKGKRKKKGKPDLALSSPTSSDRTVTSAQFVLTGTYETIQSPKRSTWIRQEVAYKLAPRASDPDDESGDTTAPPRTRASSGVSLLNSSGLTGTSTYLASRRDQAIADTAAALRKGRSDPMQRVVAGVKGDDAREWNRLHREARSREADSLVKRKTTPNSIDLHFITIEDGVRIARQKTSQWWDGLEEGKKARKARESTFKIITGQGRHSADGRASLRSAVLRSLSADGWKVEVDGQNLGNLVVWGRS